MKFFITLFIDFKTSLFLVSLNINLYNGRSGLNVLGFTESFWERSQVLDTPFFVKIRLKCTGLSVRAWWYFPIFRFKIDKNWNFQVLTKKNWRSKKTNTHTRSDQYILIQIVESHCRNKCNLNIYITAFWMFRQVKFSTFFTLHVQRCESLVRIHA